MLLSDSPVRPQRPATAYGTHSRPYSTKQAVHRDVIGWKQYWCERKKHAKDCARDVELDAQQTGGGQNTVRPLTDLKARIASLLGLNAIRGSAVHALPLPYIGGLMYYERAKKPEPERRQILELQTVVRDILKDFLPDVARQGRRVQAPKE
ncbi:hypothetical protein HPB47_021510 [Ixodes persulcatus]|uniref:Uncharacterized protein n=1 Tax=Ixodes persulcatus TaxID=34615 RepID=A0AC60QEA2_IXOPE|nr:hypothetical protein HPB47_021510 [Ixodes persulcatus]